MKNKKIPLVKNKIDPLAKQRSKDLRMIVAIVTVMLMMIFYIWMQIKIDETLRANLQLEAELRQLRIEIEASRAELNRLSDFGRIRQLADEFGMVRAQGEFLEEIQK